MGAWTHTYTSVRAYRGDGPGDTIRVKAGLHKLDGNPLPYFSVTGEVWRRGARDCEAGGAIHREIRQHWPELAPVIALHLSDSDGVPLHARPNGWYWLAGYYGGAGERYHGGNAKRQHWHADGSFNGYRESTPEECLATFAEHVRVSVEVARYLANGWRSDSPAESKRFCMEWMREQKPRWKTEAEAACQLLDRLAGEAS